jgi:D-xylose 1-dehydrogenase
MSRFARYPSLRDKVVFISGGASGIGSELVRQFSAQGAMTAFVDIDDEAAGELVAAIEADGHVVPRFERCDVRDVSALQAAIAGLAADLGPVTALVNNAGSDQRIALHDVTPDAWEESQAVNLRHHFFAAQAVAPMMRAAGGGSIVNIGSISWHVRLESLPGYTTANAGIEGLSRVLARELGADAIRVNCLIPGWILTERQRTLWLTPEVEADLRRSQCVGELLTPADVARLVLWLAADDSRLCTGQNWVVDGGWM